MNPHMLALHHLRLGGPLQEVHDIARLLVNRRLGAVLIGHRVILQRRRHLDDATRHDRVVIGARRHRHAIRHGIAVAGDKRVDIVRAVLARFDQQALVRRQRTVIHRATGVIVRIRAREMVRRAAGAIEHFARIVRAVMDLVAGGERLHLRLRQADIRQPAKRHAFEAMARRAHFLIHLQPALDGRFIERAEHAVELPVDLFQRHAVMRLRGAADGNQQQRCKQTDG